MLDGQVKATAFFGLAYIADDSGGVENSLRK